MRYPEAVVPAEIFRKVKRIEIRTRHLVNTVFSGEYHSVFKGQGMAFAEVRDYQEGDDIRTIDWNVTARMGHPFVKVYDEERELTVMLVVDASGQSTDPAGLLASGVARLGEPETEPVPLYLRKSEAEITFFGG